MILRDYIKILLIILLPSAIWGYPREEFPLRILVEKSFCIFIGYVTVENDMATIKILEMIKGRYDKTSIVVKNDLPGMICPVPIIYSDSTYSITFLYRSDTTYYPISRRQLTLEGVNYYKKCINELLEIQKITDRIAYKDSLIEWLIRCSQNRLTKWDGIIELSEFSLLEDDYMDPKTTPPLRYSYQLNAKHKKQIKEILFNLDEFTYNDIGYVDILIKDYPKEIYDFVLWLFNKKDHGIYISRILMGRINYFLKDKKLQNIIKEYDRLDFSQTDKKQWVINKFKKQLNMPNKRLKRNAVVGRRICSFS